MRMQSLLAYLLLHRHTQQNRQHVAFLFWPDLSEAQSRNNLRQVLHSARQRRRTQQSRIFPQLG